jgi:hypothetical protein
MTVSEQAAAAMETRRQSGISLSPPFFMLLIFNGRGQSFYTGL